MGPERRLHPASAVFIMGTHVRSLLVPGVIVIFTAGSSGRDWDVWLMALIVPYAIAAVVRSLSYRYRFDDDEMVVRKGWIFRSERHIPYARIQNIDAVQNVLHRALGVAEVRVETASGGEPEATMSVLPVNALDEMRRFVFSGRQGHREQIAVDAHPSHAEILLRLRPRELLLYGFIESRGAVVIAGGFGLLWEFGLFDRAFDMVTGGRVSGGGVARQLARAILGQGTPPIAQIAMTLGALVAVLFALRILSMGWAFVRLSNFTVALEEDDLRIDYGLFTHVSATIPLRRIQTLTVSEDPLHRWFGRVSVHVETAGGDGHEQQSKRREPIAPIVGRSDLDRLLAVLLGSAAVQDVEWQPPHPRAVRRAFVVTSIFALVVLTPFTLLLGWWTLAAVGLAVLWARFHARRYVASLGWAVAQDAVVFRSGWLWRRMTVAPFAKIQVVSKRESPFDRRTGMAVVRVDTAGAATAPHKVSIPYLPAATAASLASSLSAYAAETTFRW